MWIRVCCLHVYACICMCMHVGCSCAAFPRGGTCWVCVDGVLAWFYMCMCVWLVFVGVGMCLCICACMSPCAAVDMMGEHGRCFVVVVVYVHVGLCVVCMGFPLFVEQKLESRATGIEPSTFGMQAKHSSH